MIDGRETGLIAGAVILALFMPVPAADAASTGRVTVAQAEIAVDRELIGNIQRLLAERGLDPGPADGFMGPRTQQAIAAYQAAAGLPADGLPSRSLYESLAVEAAKKPAEESDPPVEAQNINVPQPAADLPVAPPVPPPVPSLTGSTWRFADAAGSAFTLAFAPNGKVEGVLYGRFWTWRQSGDEVVVTYDNGMGLTVTRSGMLDGPAAMSGIAQPSRGEPWDWRAERVSVGDSVPHTAD